MYKHSNKTGFVEQRLAALKQLEQQQTEELRVLFNDVLDSMSPAGILKNSVKDIVTSPDLRTQLLDTAIGIGAGVVGKKLFVGRSDNILKKIGGTALEFILGNFIRKKMPGLRNKARSENGSPQHQ